MRSLAIFAVLCLAAGPLAAVAQEAQNPVAGAEDAPPPASWATRCVSGGRAEPLDCSISQRAVTQQGQLVGAVSIRMLPDGADPIMVVTAPLGLYIPAGISYAIDEGTLQPLQLRTCERGGCVADIALSANALEAMRGGQKLNILFQDGTQRTVTLPMSLAGFTAAIEKAR
jgi:invasion protein IalB